MKAAMALFALLLGGCAGDPVPAPDLACTRVFQPYPYDRAELPARARVWAAGHNAAGVAFCQNRGPWRRSN